MVRRLSCVPLVLVAALAIGASGANAFDDARYPDWGGGWYRIGSGNWDPDKPRGLGQEAPLTPEYQTILEASIAAQDNGSQGNNAGYRCIPHGMPRLDSVANVRKIGAVYIRGAQVDRVALRAKWEGQWRAKGQL